MDISVEASGETVGEAKWLALRELDRLQPGLDKGSVRFQVVSEGERGLLGVGYAPAKVVATIARAADAEPPADKRATGDSELAAGVRELLERLAAGVGVHCRVRIDEDSESLTASCVGDDLGLLIGKHGQTIDAIQHLVNAIVWREAREARKPIVIDAAGYRERRRLTLESLALRSAERALREGSAVELEPMSAVERKVVHLRLQDEPGIETRSEGTEPNRYVVVAPTGA